MTGTIGKIASLLRRDMLLLLFLAGTCTAQTNDGIGMRDADGFIVSVDDAKAEYLDLRPRELTVLSETLSEAQLDRAVLNRLMLEISTDPEKTKTRIGLNDAQLQEAFVIISNARGFINGSELANVRAMCSAWETSVASRDSRIAEAIAAYKAREQLTQNFIAKFYSVVLFDIEALLDEKSLSQFRDYMIDRRRRLSSAGITSLATPVQNIRAGTDSIDFHCHQN